MMTTAVQRIEAALESLAEGERPEAWISLREPEELLREARSIDARCSDGEDLPLAGWTVAVKDNIDVQGLTTTAGCQAFAYQPAVDATAVRRLREAGAIVLGKNSLDQFATGLVGTRSPLGEVRDVRDPDRVSGGSSSGSAVAVALGIADLAVGTDTAGSGRVPASFQGIVGLKPTVGLVPVDGVVPACRSFDCVSLMAPELGAVAQALEIVADPVRPNDAPLGYKTDLRLAAFPAAALSACSPEFFAAYIATVDRLRLVGVSVEEIDPAPFLSAGELLYGGAFVAERFAAVGAFIADHPSEIDPAVAQIVMNAEKVTAADYIADSERLVRLRVAALGELHGFDAMVLPTAPWQPTIEAVRANPIELNQQLGSYVTFCNLIGLCGISLPAGEAGSGEQFGVTLYARAFHDLALVELAERVVSILEPGVTRAGALSSSYREVAPAGSVPLLVVGAHMSGMPLNSELTSRGGRHLRAAQTAANYRLYALNTEPAKPGLVRVDDGASGAVPVAGELWALPPTGLASLLAELPQPMTLGRVELADGSSVTGFLCEPAALTEAREISEFGGWRSFLAAA